MEENILKKDQNSLNEPKSIVTESGDKEEIIVKCDEIKAEKILKEEAINETAGPLQIVEDAFNKLKLSLLLKTTNECKSMLENNRLSTDDADLLVESVVAKYQSMLRDIGHIRTSDHNIAKGTDTFLSNHKGDNSFKANYSMYSFSRLSPWPGVDIMPIAPVINCSPSTTKNCFNGASKEIKEEPSVEVLKRINMCSECETTEKFKVDDTELIDRQKSKITELTRVETDSEIYLSKIDSCDMENISLAVVEDEQPKKPKRKNFLKNINTLCCCPPECD